MGEILPNGKVQSYYAKICKRCGKEIRVNFQGAEMTTHACVVRTDYDDGSWDEKHYTKGLLTRWNSDIDKNGDQLWEEYKYDDLGRVIRYDDSDGYWAEWIYLLDDKKIMTHHGNGNNKHPKTCCCINEYFSEHKFLFKETE